MPGATPDLDTIQVVWAANYQNGTVPTGRIRIRYDGGRMLDPDSTYPVMSLVREFVQPLIEKTVSDSLGRPMLVAEAVFPAIPVSNDDDIIGGGGTYTVTEELTEGGGKTFHFYADKDTVGGVIRLAELSAGIDVSGGDIVPVITAAQFSALETRVSDLEDLDPGSGTVSSVNSVAPDGGGNVVLDKSDIGLGNVQNFAPADMGISTDTQEALDAKADLVGGKVPTAQLPTLPNGATVPVASQAAMLALSTAVVGDFAVRTDLSNQPYRLAALPASTLGNWIAFGTTPSVTSVAGKTGTVSLVKGDVGLGNVDNTTDAAKPISTAAQTAFDARHTVVRWNSVTRTWGSRPAVTWGVLWDSMDDSTATQPPLLNVRDMWARRPAGV